MKKFFQVLLLTAGMSLFPVLAGYSQTIDPPNDGCELTCAGTTYGCPSGGCATSEDEGCTILDCNNGGGAKCCPID